MPGRQNRKGWKAGQVLLAAGAGAALLWWLWPDDKSGGTTHNDLDINPDNLTYPRNQYKVIADSLEAFIWGNSGIASWTEDDQAIGNGLKLMFTADDVAQLIQDYGVRKVGVFIQDGGNLVESIAEYLDEDVKADVNATYASRGIPFIWP